MKLWHVPCAQNRSIVSEDHIIQEQIQSCGYLTQCCHNINIFTHTTEDKSEQLTSHKESDTCQGAEFRFEPFQQRNQAYCVHQHVEESQVDEGKCIQSIHAAEPNFFGDQCAPLYHTPDCLELKKPEGNDREENEAGEERQSEDVGSQACGIEGGRSEG